MSTEKTRRNAHLVLEGEPEANYLGHCTKALRRARLNKQYPDARALAKYLNVMGSATHHGLHRGLWIDVRSGLPMYREWVRVRTDRSVAEQALDDLPAADVLQHKARTSSHNIYGKQMLKRSYYERLSGVELSPIDHMDVALRYVTPSERTAYFLVTLDKLDATGLFVRYTIELSQQHSVWNQTMVVLDGDLAKHTDQFRSLVLQLASFGTDMIFRRLASADNINVTRVVRGTIGPIFFRGVEMPPMIEGAMGDEKDSFVATFGLEMAATDVAKDRDNDPLEQWIGDAYSKEARTAYESSRRRLSYRVFKDRKFVAPRTRITAIREMCEQAGTRNIVYPLD